MFSRRRKAPCEQSQEREKERETNIKLDRITGKQPKILKPYVQWLRNSFLKTAKPLFFGGLPFWWVRVADTDSAWYQDFITPVGTRYFLCRTLGSTGAAMPVLLGLLAASACLNTWLPAPQDKSSLAMTLSASWMQTHQKHWWKWCSREEASIWQSQSANIPQWWARCRKVEFFSLIFLQFYFNMQLTTTQIQISTAAAIIMQTWWVSLYCGFSVF